MTEEQKVIHKEFRYFLRTEREKKGNLLNMLIDAAEQTLPKIITGHLNIDFGCLYDDVYTIEQLLDFSQKIKSDEELMLTAYLASKSLDLYIEFYAQKHNIDLTSISLPEDNFDDDIDEEFVEGEENDVVSKRYERNQRAKKKCISVKGCKCYVCGFDFEKEYGDLGKGFIEVHHIIPVSQRGGSYRLNPETDLIPLCSNCHSMVHRKKNEVMDVDDLKRIYESMKKE